MNEGSSLLEQMIAGIQEASVKRASDRNSCCDENTFHVSDLCYCRRKQLLMRGHPELQAEIMVKPAVFNGIVFEIGLRQYIWDFFDTTEYIPRFAFRSKKKVGRYVVTGEADVVLFKKPLSDYKVDTVIDIKNRVFGNKWKEHYVLQLLLYKWLFNAENILLWCFSSAAKHKEWRIDNKIDDDTVLAIIKNSKQPMWEWECNYCQFKQDCPYRKVFGVNNGK